MQEFYFNDRICLIDEKFDSPWEVVGSIVYDLLGNHRVVCYSRDSNEDGMLEPVRDGERIKVMGEEYEVSLKSVPNKKIVAYLT